jgi:hypothetical protein
MTATERAAQAAAHDTGRIDQRTGDQMRVAAWPIHEPGWRREIVRAEPLWAEP